MTTAAFCPDMIASSASLTRFLDGAEETAAILRAGSSSSRLAGRWEVNSDIAEMYHLSFALVLTMMSYMLYGLCLSGLSNRVWVWSRHEQNEATTIKVQQFFQERFLAQSINTHRLDTADFYLQTPTRMSFYGGQALDVNFFCSEGVCRGMSLWFAFLYLKTEGRFADPENHLRAVATEFEKGASRQAAFLHAVKSSETAYRLLNLNVLENYRNIPPQGKTEEQIFQEIQGCAPGLYGFYTSAHQMIYIKKNDGRQYLFDPTKGVFKIDSPLYFKKAIEPYLAKHDPGREILIDRYS